ncbi:MAG TPA: Gfo/Idh/MocA family oxidoreductase [Geminicoccaceae bacterium]
MEPVRFGVISTARIAREKVIPAMQKGKLTRIAAIASRDPERARRVADELGIDRAYGSYAELLADAGIEAVYNPLPNHLHVPITIEAASAGKHVLCEKPIALSAEEAEKLIGVRQRTGRLILEAFMVRQHPQWRAVRELVRAGRIGDVRAFQMTFGYANLDPDNVRNRADIGGGALYDIGCYPIALARFVLGREPARVAAVIEHDPAFRTDRLTSALLDFGDAQASFTVSTQIAPYQRALIFGSDGRIEVEVPVNAPPDRRCRVLLAGAGGTETLEHEAVDQYTLQGDVFAELVRTGAPPPFPLEDAIRNMAVIDATFRAAASGRFEAV